MKKILFEELYPDELKQIIKKSGTIFLPLGSLEWHAHHLPFGFDAMASYEICKNIAIKVNGCVIPPLYFGTDRESKIKGKIMHGMDAKVGRIMPGSIYFINKKLFYNLIKSIAKSVADQGFKKLVIVSAHSGTAQHQAIEKLSKEKFGKLKIFAFPGRNFPGSIDHAGKTETSLMLKINPKLVRLKKIKKPYIGISGEDPKKSSQAEGQKRFNAIVKMIKKEITK